MKTLSSLWFTVRSLVARRTADAELDEELAFHLDRQTELNVANGMSPADARREAIRLFGGVQKHRESTRDIRRLRWLDDLGADLRLSLRHMRFHPGFTANVVIIAAVGIAICVSTFSVVSGVLLTPLPFPHPDWVVAVELRGADGSESAAFPTDAYLRIADGSPVFDAIAYYKPAQMTMLLDGHPRQFQVQRVTPSFFRVYGVAPAIGRAFAPSEGDDGANVAVISNRTWLSTFGGDSSLIGRTVLLDGTPRTVIGVMPRSFSTNWGDPAFWVPLATPRTASTGGGKTVNSPVARLKPGVTSKRAAAWIATTVRVKMPTRFGEDSVPATGGITPVSDYIYGYVARPLYVLLGAVGLVLLLVAANIATMFLARSTARERELSLRRALGASYGRQLRQLVTESLVLTLIGGIAGVVASIAIVRSIQSMGLRVLPRMDHVTLDWRVFLFAIAITVCTGIAGGLAPAIARRLDASGRERQSMARMPSGLVVAQMALSVVLLVGSGLLLKGFLRVLPSNGGIELDGRTVVSVDFVDTVRYPVSDPAARRRFVQEEGDRLRRIDGVEDVAAVLMVPFTGSLWTGAISIPGRPVPDKAIRSNMNLVTPNYFTVLGVALTRGRLFGASDVAGAARVVIVNETAAREWWPGENPIGQPLVAGSGPDRLTVTVVGVVHDTRFFAHDTQFRPEIFYPFAQDNPGHVNFIVKARGRSLGAGDLEASVWAVAPTLVVTRVIDLAAWANESVSRTRFFSTALSIFSTAAIILSAFGVYGLLAFSVAQRRREIGIRMALGAPLGRIGGMVVGRGLVLGATGMLIGIVVARGLTRFMQSLLVEVKPTDGAVFTMAAVAAVLVAAIAACVPAIQAVRVDPVKSLRV